MVSPSQTRAFGSVLCRAVTAGLIAWQAQDYRIQYDSIVRLFVLPKSNVPQTLVVISLDPPIRKGQTYYPHILCQFNNDDELNIELDITEEQLEAKNEKVGRLHVVWQQREVKGACINCTVIRFALTTCSM